MPQQNVGERISEKLARSREKLERRVEETQARLSELQPEFEALAEELEALDAELEQVSSSADPARYARLEVRRERLLAKQERLQIRQEILETKIQSYQEALTQLRQQWTRIPGLATPTPRPSEGDLEAERRKILEMVAQGKISAEDAARLLEAMEEQKEAPTEGPRPRVVHVRVSDTESGRTRVDIRLPLELLRRALRGARAFGPDIDIAGLTFDVHEMEELLRAGVEGHLIDIVDDEDGERVEVFVE